MYKNIIFDIGMVLVDFNWSDLLSEVGCDNEEIKQFEDVFFIKCLWDELDRGVMSEEEVWEEAYTKLPNMKDKLKAFWARRGETIIPFDYSVSMIKELKNRGYKVFLLTNYPMSLFQICIDEGRFPFYDLIDGEVVSSHVKMRKPDREIYKELLSKYNLNADECLFTDDKPENIEGAKAVGIEAILFEGYEKTMAEIARREC